MKNNIKGLFVLFALTCIGVEAFADRLTLPFKNCISALSTVDNAAHCPDRKYPHSKRSPTGAQLCCKYTYGLPAPSDSQGKADERSCWKDIMETFFVENTVPGNHGAKTKPYRQKSLIRNSGNSAVPVVLISENDAGVTLLYPDNRGQRVNPGTCKTLETESDAFGNAMQKHLEEYIQRSSWSEPETEFHDEHRGILSQRGF